MSVRYDKQALLWTGAVIAVAAGFLLVVTRSQIGQLRGLTEKIRTDRAEQHLGQTELQAIEELQREMDKLAARTAHFDDRIPEREMLGKFLEDLARFTEARHLRTEDIEPGKPVASDQVIALPIALRVRGSFPEVYGLIQDIEGMDRLTQVERFKAETDLENPGVASAEVSLRVFYQAS